MLFTILVLALIAITTYAMMGTTKHAEKAEAQHLEELSSAGIDLSTRIELGKYIGGHPDIDNPEAIVYGYDGKDGLVLYGKKYRTPGSVKTVYFERMGYISYESIKDIGIEDLSSLQQKVSMGRVLLVGVAALGWTKETRLQRAFLNIQWEDGRFKHQTIFEYTHAGALSKSNTNRNALLRLLKSNNPTHVA